MLSRVKISMGARSCNFRTDSYKFRKGKVTCAQRSKPSNLPKIFPQNGRLLAPKQRPKSAKVARKLRSATSQLSGGTRMIIHDWCVQYCVFMMLMASLTPLLLDLAVCCCTADCRCCRFVAVAELVRARCYYSRTMPAWRLLYFASVFFCFFT